MNRLFLVFALTALMALSGRSSFAQGAGGIGTQSSGSGTSTSGGKDANNDGGRDAMKDPNRPGTDTTDKARNTRKEDPMTKKPGTPGLH